MCVYICTPLQSIDRFDSERAALISWGPNINRDVVPYVDGLMSWIVGNTAWSFETERYLEKTGHRVKATRVVDILTTMLNLPFEASTLFL